MKIREMILTLVKSGQDFSDHGMFVSTGGEMGPKHDEDCAFCDAWRAALYFLSESARFYDFEPGDKIMLPGSVRGRVIGIDTVVRVEVQGGDHAPWAVGSFRPEDLRAADADEVLFTWWRDRDGAIWQRFEETRKALMIRDEDGEAPEGLSRLIDRPGDYPMPFDRVRKTWGPMTKAKRP